MEFFSGIQHPHLDIPALKNLLTIDNLPSLCASISSATPDSDNAGNIYCLWGAFSLRRDEIRKRCPLCAARLPACPDMDDHRRRGE